MVVVEVGNPFLQLVAALALIHAEVEQVDVGVQRELVHRINAAHVIEDEEEDGGSLGAGAVSLLREYL